jgi:hypothetical protein
LDLDALLGDSLGNPMTAVAWALKAQAEKVGQKIGVQYGEAFRYARFHPFVESLLEGNVST